jgi:hypothetical protein
VKALGRSVGITKPGLQATASRVTVVLSVQPDGAPAFDVEHSEFIMGSDLQYLKVGASIPVRVVTGDPAKLAFDWDKI